MHEQQRKFFNDPRRHVLSLGVRHGRTQRGQEIKQAIARQAVKRNALPEIAIDECKEMTREDFEQLRSRPSMQHFISTEKDHNWAEYIDNLG